jgi:hypothetical protein|tara:strand:- start:983 stop:1237 length:255 start_codon:yes stop_codon:yes gene_type:complete
MSETKRFVIVDRAELDGESIDFSVLPYTSKEKLRYSLDGSQAVVKFFGNKPSFFYGKTDYTYNQIILVLQNSDWCEEPDPSDFE